MIEHHTPRRVGAGSSGTLPATDEAQNAETHTTQEDMMGFYEIADPTTGPRIARRFASPARLKELMSSYQNLFGVVPQVSLYGTWKTDRDELVFFHFDGSNPIESIGRKYITLQVDGVLLHVKPTADSSIALYSPK